MKMSVKKPLEITGRQGPSTREILTPGALEFVATLVSEFGGRLERLLEDRRSVQARFDRGERPDFPSDTQVRDSDWEVATIPPDLRDRRVEITGPVDRKMVINALNSGANVFMADFEDATAPTWANVIDGQVNLRDAIRRTIEYVDADRDKHYSLNPNPATLVVRPRGLHLPEDHLRLDGRPIPAALVDFGLYFYHNTPALLAAHTAPYFYLPKLQSHHEARLWNDVFAWAQRSLGVPYGTIRATVLIETLPAAFEMDEILWELRDHSAGLNCGRWDYIFSFIKTLRTDPSAILPDRGLVGMTQPNMRAYTQLVIKTCHRRGIHAIGGMAAQIPLKHDPAANEAAMAKVRADKEREVLDGHDGTWVAHPGLVPLAREVFDQHMKGPHQIERRRDDVTVSQADLLRVPEGDRTVEGLRHDVRVGIQYLESWLRGHGCVPLYGLMEDAATAEISRAQVWQWLHHRVALADGVALTRERVVALIDEEMGRIADEVGKSRFDQGRFPAARRLFEQLVTSSELADFLTIPAYQELLQPSTSEDEAQ